MIRKVKMERLTVISARPFDEVVAAIKASIGNPDMAEFWKSAHEAKSAAELDTAVQRVLGRTGLMLLVEFDHGMVVRRAPSATTQESFVSSLGSSHHERNGEACSGRWLVRAGYGPRG